jgi:hypothetical protein
LRNDSRGDVITRIAAPCLAPRHERRAEKPAVSRRGTLRARRG